MIQETTKLSDAKISVFFSQKDDKWAGADWTDNDPDGASGDGPDDTAELGDADADEKLGDAEDSDALAEEEEKEDEKSSEDF